MVKSAASYVGPWELDGVSGVIVAVDVLRAFTTAAYALGEGATCIWVVAGIKEALDLAREIPHALVMGEQNGRRPLGFDLSNSPVAVARAGVADRELVQRTTAGTQALIAATSADRLFAASLVCASATAAAITSTGLGAPSYVITGRVPDDPERGEDDLITAQLIERARIGAPLDAVGAAKAVARSREAARTLTLGEGHVDPDDVVYATAVDRFDFAMEVERVNRRLRLVRRAI